MSDEMRQALTERRTLMEGRADAVLDRDLVDSTAWTATLGAQPSDSRSVIWRRSARIIAAYRDRYQINADTVLGAPPETTTQKVDRARAEAALRIIEKLFESQRITAPTRVPQSRAPRL